jgi:hypothetical protein
MAKKLLIIVSYLFLFAFLAFAEDANAAPTAAIEIRQYLTMAIVAVVCVAGGILLFFKTGHP